MLNRYVEVGLFQITNNCDAHKSQIGCALALANFSFCQSSGPMVQHSCHGITISIHPKPVQNLFVSLTASHIEVLNRLQMYGNGYSMAIILDHRSTALTETKLASAKTQPIWDLWASQFCDSKKTNFYIPIQHFIHHP